MRTEIITAGNIARAAEIIRAGGLVAVPTETVYGLAANGLDAAAVERIYARQGPPGGQAAEPDGPGRGGHGALLEPRPSPGAEPG